MAVTFTEERPLSWRRNRLRGGAPATDTERIIMFCLVMLFCGALVTGIIGSTLYILKVNSNSNLRVTSCEVLGKSLLDDLKCHFEECVNTDCKLVEKQCFEPQWHVTYSEVDSEGEVLHRKINAFVTDSTFRDQGVALRRLEEYQLTHAYKCTYDSSDVANVHWGYDDPEPWMITMIVAWGIIAIFLCAMGFGWFFSKSNDV